MLRSRCVKCAGWAGWVSVAGNVSLACIKWVAGLTCGSQALIADAAHSSVDVLGSVITLVMLKLSRKKPSAKYPYGLGKLEDVSALAIYLILIAAGSAIVIEALAGIVSGDVKTPEVPAFFAGVVSVAVNAFMFFFISCAGRQNCSPSLLALGYENKVDALSSVAAVFGILGAIVGFPILDPLAAVAVAGFIIVESAKELMEASQRLMDRALEPEVRQELRRVVGNAPFVKGIKGIKTRRIGAKAHADIDIFVDSDVSVEASRAIAESLGRRVQLDVKSIDVACVYAHPLDVDESPRLLRVAELVDVVSNMGERELESGGKP